MSKIWNKPQNAYRNHKTFIGNILLAKISMQLSSLLTVFQLVNLQVWNIQVINAEDGARKSCGLLKALRSTICLRQLVFTIGFHFYQYQHDKFQGIPYNIKFVRKKIRQVLRCFCQPLCLHKNLYKQMQSNHNEQNYGNNSIEINLLKLLKKVNDLFNYENNSQELTC